jgi:hypothetical protein
MLHLQERTRQGASWALLVAIAVPNAVLPQPTLSYRFEAAGRPHSLRIELTLPAPGRREERMLHLPPGPFGPAEELGRQVVISEVQRGSLKPGPTSATRILTGDGSGAPIVIDYELRQAYDGPPADRMRVFWPSIQPEYWYFAATMALVVPDFEQATEIDLFWEVPAGGGGWKMVSSRGVDLACDPGCQLSFRANDDEELRGGPSQAVFFTAGNLLVSHVRMQQAGPLANDLYVSLYGVPDYVTDPGAILESVQAIVSVHQDLWRRPVYERFVVNLITFPNQEANNFGGFNGSQAFSSFVPQRSLPVWEGGLLPAVDRGRLLAHIAHEYGHTWLRPELFDLEPSEQPRLLWFTEGISEFVADQVLLSAGLLDEQAAVDRANEKLRRYFELFRQARNALSEDIVARFWGDYGLQRQPYLRGYLLALNWNARIRAQSGGGSLFLDFVKQLVDEASGAPLSEEALYARSEAFLEGGIRADVQRHWVDGRTISPDPTSFGPCFGLVEKAGIPQFEPVC